MPACGRALARLQPQRWLAARDSSASGAGRALAERLADGPPSATGREHAGAAAWQPFVVLQLSRAYAAAAPGGAGEREGSAAANKPSAGKAQSSAAPAPAPAAASATATASATSATAATIPAFAPIPSVAAAAAVPLVTGLAARYSDPDAIPEQLLSRVREALFGQPIAPQERTGRRALARPLRGRTLASWYFMPPREAPGFHNEEAEYEKSKALNRRQKAAAIGEDDTGSKGGKKKKK